MSIYLITAIDTGVGKSVVTGMLARQLARQGRRVITAKPVQTGCGGMAEDILIHRKLMGTGLLPEDNAGLTCNYTFDMPASPHLAARQENKAIDPALIADSIKKLSASYDTVLVEGAGGLLVPLTDKFLTVDLAFSNKWKLIIVTTPRLGSINHTLLTLFCAASFDCEVAAVVYNHYCPEGENDLITQDSRNIIQTHLKMLFPQASWIEMPCITDFDNLPEIIGITLL
ncbi:MAG: ATP-dependent dethiobiotin synthetase BioD [Sedimentisphaerales bacterium]|nr:ATP-dependent dethiobiotin synthetase BioD [Sedimentisphaerales bacterium]MBN2843879.1 ATP-dependent dethiobiotin synthetase BioD [Sedimentisphaerales bacterium]